MGSFSISFTDEKKHQIRITDINGKLIKSATISGKDGTFDFSDFSAGTYFIEADYITYQIVKQ